MEKTELNEVEFTEITECTDEFELVSSGNDDVDVIYIDEGAHKIMAQQGNIRWPVCDELVVKNVEKNVDTGYMWITFIHRNKFEENEISIELSGLKRSAIFTRLSNLGVMLYESESLLVSNYLLHQIDNYINCHNTTHTHSKLGWVDRNDMSKGYFASKSIGCKKNSELINNDEKMIGPNGDEKIFNDMIDEEVIKNKSLHLPFVLAFTAPIIPLLYKESGVPVLLTNFAGKSSMGKSTCISLMAGMWGKGIISNSKLSVAKTFCSTQNGFEASVNENNGFPVMFDDYEASCAGVDFGKLIYMLQQGSSKTRSTKLGKQADTFQWRTFIGTTGESSIFERTSNNLGLKVRIIEFKNVKWTVSRQNSINITGTLTENYGFLGEKFISKLEKFGREELVQIYKESLSIFDVKLPPKTALGDRIQTRLAIIRTAAVLVRKLLDLEVDVDYITDLLYQNQINNQDNLKVDEMAKEKLIEYINKNLSYFVRFDKRLQTTIVPGSSIVGKIKEENGKTYVMVLTENFKKLMLEFNDREAILETWRDSGFLQCDSDNRFTKKRRITSFVSAPRVYEFCFDTNELSNDQNVNEVRVPQSEDRHDYDDVGDDNEED